MSNFEKATRKALRFTTSAGNLSVEDLWNLPLISHSGRPNLDDIAVALDKQLKEADTTSFVRKSVKTDEELRLKFDIVLHIIEVRQAEEDAAATAEINRQKKQQILMLIAQKENDQLAGSSLEELRAMAEAL